MNKTNIEWALNPDGTKGYTWNPITGCLNGCEYCYAKKLANGRLKTRYLANDNLAPPPYKSGIHFCVDLINPFYPRFWTEKMWLHELVGSKRKPKGIFVCSMSDLFGIGVPEEWTRRVLAVIEKFPQHRFYLLTKQPQNLIKFSPFPDNAWVGVSVTNDNAFDRALYHLMHINCKIRYLSFEPLLDEIKLAPSLLTSIDWVIIGAQTNPTVMPKIEWVQEIVEACDKAGIPVFLKKSLAPLFATGPGHRKVAILRQQMPEMT